jgi:hypothetical protein
MINYLINFREFMVSNFGIIIYGLVFKNNKIYYLNDIYKYLFCFIPFNLLQKFVFFNIIYKKDNIFYITNINTPIIVPTILNFTLNKPDNTYLDMTYEIKYYNSFIPIKFFIDYNNLYDYETINLKYISKGKMVNKLIYINLYYNYKLIYDLF